MRVLAAVRVEHGDVFLEIGPGRGELTLPLAGTGAPVLAVEIDRDLVAYLATQVPANVTVLSGDILHTDPLPFLAGMAPQGTPQASGTAGGRRFRVVGNLPYNVSSPLLFWLIDLHRRHGFFHDATIMLQREVADRLVAKVGTKAYGVLTILVGLHARIERVLDLPPTAFKPAPKVRSAVVRLTFGPPSVRIADEALFERLIKTIFSHRRKTMSNALKAFDVTGPAILSLAGIDGRRRPETLQVTEMARLAELFATARRTPVV
jgi:16S rRNA (adenine1518-N6/adenine1519-N6)-dimethyltransferase